MSTRSVFVERIINEVSENRSIPISPKPQRLKQIIDEAVRYFHQFADEAVEFEYIIIPRGVTDTPLFKSKRQVQLPKCVEAVTGLSETGALLNTGSNNINPDYRKTNFNYHLAVGGDSDSMLYGVIASYYSDFIRNFVLRRVTFEYSSHTNMLTIVGRDHFFDLVVQSYVHISEEALFEDQRFFEYTVGKTKMSFTNVFGFVDSNLIGGLSLSISEMKEDGKAMVEDVKEQLKEDRQTVDFVEEF